MRSLDLGLLTLSFLAAQILAVASAAARQVGEESEGAVPDRLEVQAFDVEYRRDSQRAWLARIYQPNGEGPFPGLVSVHGGTWTDFDRTSEKQSIRR